MHYNRMSSLVNETLPKRNHSRAPGRSSPLAAVVPTQNTNKKLGDPTPKSLLSNSLLPHAPTQTQERGHDHDFNVFSFFTAININWQCSYTTAQTTFQALADNCKQ